MSFFLLGKYPDDRLTLLSDMAFPTRQEAMGELSRLTATPEFSAWEAEVLIIDSTLGAPVLLVRPSAPDTPIDTPTENAVETPTVEPAAEPLAEPMPETDAEPAEVPDAALAAVILDLGMGDEPLAEENAEQDTAPEDESAPQEQETADDESSGESPVETAAAEDSFLGESDGPVEVVDAAWADAVVESGETPKDGLKGALKRTAEQMESQGISAPDSIGPAGAIDEDASEEIASVAADIETSEEDVAQPESAEAEQQADTPVDEPALETEGQSDDAESPDESESLGATEPPVAGWPWDARVEPDEPVEGASPEEPGPDDESMIRALADDSASRTVVLGEYAVDDVGSKDSSGDVKEADSEPTTAADAPDSLIDIEPATSSAEAEPAVADEPSEEQEPESGAETPSAVEDGAEEVSQDPESDFVDLGEVAPEPVTKAYEPGDVDMEEMTCDDCVYVDTCPNKDEREPKTCGSFQWK